MTQTQTETVTETYLTISGLRSLLRAAAGEPEGVDLDGNIVDLEFELLGYDSLALLEVSSRIQRLYGVELDDSLALDARTPRTFIEAVNALVARSAR